MPAVCWKNGACQVYWDEQEFLHTALGERAAIIMALG